MRCLILLLLVGSAFAQPVRGPYVVNASSFAVDDIEICSREDTVDILYASGDTDGLFDSVNYVAFNLQQSISDAPINVIGVAFDWYLELLDMNAVSPQKWMCLLHSNDRGPNWGFGTFEFGTNILAGKNHSNIMVNVESSSYTDYPNIHDGQWSEGHSMTVRDSLMSIAYHVVDVGPFDLQYSVAYREFNSDLDDLVYAEYVGGMFSTGNEASNRAICLRTPGDSVLAFTNWGSETNLFIGPESGIENWEHTRSIDCDFRGLREMYLTSSNRIIVIFDDNSLFQIVPGEGGDADCLPFAPLDESWSPSWAFHPNYGFAAIQALPGYLLLARIDTSGNEVQPVGVLYETDGTSFIVDADVTISDSGEVIAVWSEYTDWNEGPHVLKIAWTDWTTYLDTPEQQAPAIPRQISLSSYPNPFNSTVTIKYDLPIASRVTLSIFDIQGRLVETIRDDFTPSGNHTQSWSPTELASGVYFARLNADHVSATSKLLYLK